MDKAQLFNRPSQNFGVIHQSGGDLAVWKMGALEDDDLYYVLCDRAGQELSPRIVSKLRVELLFAWCDRSGPKGVG